MEQPGILRRLTSLEQALVAQAREIESLKKTIASLRQQQQQQNQQKLNQIPSGGHQTEPTADAKLELAIQKAIERYQEQQQPRQQAQFVRTQTRLPRNSRNFSRGQQQQEEVADNQAAGAGSLLTTNHHQGPSSPYPMNPHVHPPSAIPPGSTSVPATNFLATVHRRAPAAGPIIAPGSSLIDNSFAAHTWSSVAALKSQSQRQISARLAAAVSSAAATSCPAKEAPGAASPSSSYLHKINNKTNFNEEDPSMETDPDYRLKKTSSSSSACTRVQHKSKKFRFDPRAESRIKEKENETKQQQARAPIAMVCSNEEEARDLLIREQIEAEAEEHEGILYISFRKFNDGRIRMVPLSNQNGDRFARGPQKQNQNHLDPSKRSNGKTQAPGAETQADKLAIEFRKNSFNFIEKSPSS